MDSVQLYKHAFITSHVMSASTINQSCFTSNVTSKASCHKKILFLLVIDLLSNLHPLLLFFFFAYLLHMTLLIVGPTHHIGSPPTSPMWMRSFFCSVDMLSTSPSRHCHSHLFSSHFFSLSFLFCNSVVTLLEKLLQYSALVSTFFSAIGFAESS